MNFQLVPSAYAAVIEASQWEAKGCAESGVVTIKGIECIFSNIVSPIPALLALVAVGMIIYAGIRLLTAGADPKAYAAAWSTLTWAVIGLILLSGAWLIIVIIGRFTGADLSTFTISLPQ